MGIYSHLISLIKRNYLVGKLRGAEPPKGRALALRSLLPGRLAQHPSLPGGPRLGASSFGTRHTHMDFSVMPDFLVFVLCCFAIFVIIASSYGQTQLLRGRGRLAQAAA